MRYVIVNGDDFGYSDEVNQAIIKAHQQGFLTSASLMVTGEKAEDAVKLAQANPNLGVGLHLVLCCGKSVLNPSQIPDLVDKQGNFANSPAIGGIKYQFLPQAKAQLKKEIKAQLKLFQATGLTLSHVDGHLHLHTHPLVLKILGELAEEFGIKFIRLPSEELSFSLGFDNDDLLTKVVYDAVFRQLRLTGEKLLNGYGVKYLDRVYGLVQTGKISKYYLLDLIPQITANCVEIYAHPQYYANSLLPDLELQALCSKEVKDMLSSNGFQLVNYCQLEELL